MLTVLGAFDDHAQAQRAVQQLVQRGFTPENIHIERGETVTEAADSTTGSGGGFFSHLFGGSDKHQAHAELYHEVSRRGTSVVLVDAVDDSQAEKAVDCLHGLGAIDVDERGNQLRAAGWAPSQQPGQRAATTGNEGVLEVVQEELQVGKRSLNKGGVRVIQRVSETPVREVVRLREERAVVDRRPVDRPATRADLADFKESTLEVRESAEEAVVAKTARVVEEVRVGKEVREREEVVEDKVRRKDVDVQRIEGNSRGTVERDRAVASDRLNEPPLADRDPGASVTGTRKTLRKDES
jgi:stress response protein YsnF